MEALAEAAAIGERNVKLTAQTDAKPLKDNDYYEAKINRPEMTIETMQNMMASEQKNVTRPTSTPISWSSTMCASATTKMTALSLHDGLITLSLPWPQEYMA